LPKYKLDKPRIKMTFSTSPTRQA